MTAPYDDRHVFIVRIWLEPREIAEQPPQLRGSVEHVPSGERRSIKALEEVTAFMARFVPAAQPHPRRRQWPHRAERDSNT